MSAPHLRPCLRQASMEAPSDMQQDVSSPEKSVSTTLFACTFGSCSANILNPISPPAIHSSVTLMCQLPAQPTSARPGSAQKLAAP